MPLWKRLLLNLYYYGSHPARRWNQCCAVAEERVPVVVLLYHRIADDRANEWTTSNRLFARQVRWLKDHFELVSLQEARARIRRGANHRPCVSITFDDGYADNCHQAIPLLVKHRIPCTYFVTAQNVLQGEPFAHDVAMGNRPAPNTVEELKAMAAAGIEIGAHAYTHADLARITDPRRLHYQIASARDDLQGLIGRPVRFFAFPFGLHAHLSRAAFEAARQAGYAAVCSAYGGYNFPGDDPFHLQRIAAGDSMIALKNRVTVDPRKLHVPRFEYAPAVAAGSVPGGRKAARKE